MYIGRVDKEELEVVKSIWPSVEKRMESVARSSCWIEKGTPHGAHDAIC